MTFIDVSYSQWYSWNLNLIRNVVFVALKVLNSDNFSIVSEARNVQVDVAGNPQRGNSFQKQKLRYLTHTYSDKAFNRTLPNLLMEGDLKLRLQSL